MARVLLVEDDTVLRTVLAESLADDGHEVVAVDSPRSAAPVLQTRPVDVIVTDAFGDAVRGLSDEARRWLRRVGRIAPTILHSGVLWAQTISAEELGVHRVIPKPADLDTLSGAIDELARGRTDGRAGSPRDEP